MDGYNFNGEALETMAAARAEARRLGQRFIGTEHLLLGVLANRSNVASGILGALRVPPEEIRSRIEGIVRRSSEPLEPDAEMPYTSGARKVIELAMNAARSLQQDDLGSEHLLLALLAEERGIAAQVLTDVGVNHSVLREAILATTAARRPGEPSPGEATATETLKRDVAYFNSFLAHLPSIGDTPVLDELRRRFSPLGGEYRPIYPGAEQVGASVPNFWRDDMLTVIADLDALPADVVVEVLAALDMLHRAWGGGGLVLEAQSVGAVEDIGAAV